MRGSFHVPLRIAKVSTLVLLCGFVEPSFRFIDSVHGPADVDLELVLAVDTSSSMSAEQLSLQRNGYVSAFRDLELIQAVKAGQRGRISVLYMEWAGPRHQVIVIPWTVIEEQGDAIVFANMLAAQPLNQPIRSNAGTSISGGLLFAERLFSEVRRGSPRRVIDISGDGPNNSGMPLAPVRDWLVAHDITINGLPIALQRDGSQNNFPVLNPEQLEFYYEICVIGGPDAFTMIVDDVSRFGETIGRKLVTEIVAQQNQVVLTNARASSKREFDCSSVGDQPGR